jgi:hypothetical protein
MTVSASSEQRLVVVGVVVRSTPGRRGQVGRCQDQGRRTEDHTPSKAITPEEAEAAAERLYAMAPSARITGVLADVHSWTGSANAFTHQHTGMPADDPRVVLTGVLAGATNLGLIRIAEAR